MASNRPFTRSTSGAAKGLVRSMDEGGSSLEVRNPDQNQRLLVGSSSVVQRQVGGGVERQQVSGEVQVEVGSGSSSFDSEEGSGDERSVEDQGVLVPDVVQVTGKTVADQVFAVMPQSDPVSGDVKQNAEASVRGKEKSVGDVHSAPWVNLFKDNRNLGKGMTLEAFEVYGDMLTIEEEDVDVVEEAWGYCLVGQFAGRFPGLAAVTSLREGWKVQCTHWIHRTGWIVFKFQTEEDRMKVLNGGPYFAYGRNLMLKVMPRCFRFGNEGLLIFRYGSNCRTFH